jgi:hypothetical protein
MENELITEREIRDLQAKIDITELPANIAPVVLALFEAAAAAAQTQESLLNRSYINGVGRRVIGVDRLSWERLVSSLRDLKSVEVAPKPESERADPDAELVDAFGSY